MGRPKKTDRPIRVTTYIPESILGPVQLELYSELEGKVPFGKISDLVAELLRDWLTEKRGVKL